MKKTLYKISVLCIRIDVYLMVSYPGSYRDGYLSKFAMLKRVDIYSISCAIAFVPL